MWPSQPTSKELNVNATTTTKEANMADFQVLPFDFASTEATFVAITEAAKKRFDGAISVNVRKSAASCFAERLEAEGFKVQ
jgi:hypothetical protein